MEIALFSLLIFGVCPLITPVFGQEKNDTRIIRSAYYPVQVRYYDDLLPKSDIQSGGAIEQLGNQYIGVTGKGVFFLINWDRKTDTVSAQKLPLSSPNNAAAFDAAADPVVSRGLFRVIDIVAREKDSGWQLFASHHQWLPDRECLVMRVSAMQLDSKLRPAGGKGDHWQTIYDTTPCLTLDEGNRGRIFAGHESGARLAWLAPGKLLFTTGDQEHDGWHQPVVLSQSDKHMYGKVILIDVEKKTGQVYSKGHRNPQGLYIDKDGNIWESEHGPRGGDEINLIKQGRNYGWPRVTYGTEYGRFDWPLAEKVGDHKGYEQPVYAFVPSIGTSNLIRLEDTQFKEWQGNLLIAGLSSRSLYRLALDGKRVVYAEPLQIDRRIRDLAIGPEKQIWLWGERGDMLSLSVAVIQDRGAILFQTCAGCHSTGVASGGLAPSLFQIIGRKMAVRTDYVYSDAFKKLDGVWTEELLDEFLSDPNAFAPGTAMSETKVSNPEERWAIIQYMKDTLYTW